MNVLLQNNDGRDRRPSAKTQEHEGRILSSSFCEQLADYYLQVYTHTLPLDEFSFKEMRTWGQTKISSYFILKTYWAESHLELFILLRLNSGVGEEHLSIPVSWIAARLSIARV